MLRKPGSVFLGLMTVWSSSAEELDQQLPRFNSFEELKGSRWERYLKEVYGSVSIEDPSAYPIDVSKFFMLRADYLNMSGLNVSVFNGCPKSYKQGTGMILGPQSHNPGYVRWVFQDLTHTAALPDDTWVEITHRVRHDRRDSEAGAYWMYYAPGSGVAMNLGKTIAFNSHKEGAKHFVDEAYDCYECDEVFAKMCANAKKQSFDTIQFLHHDDMLCGNSAIELVATAFVGNHACGPQFYGGLGDTRCKCTCSDTHRLEIANCNKCSQVKVHSRLKVKIQLNQKTQSGGAALIQRYRRSATLGVLDAQAGDAQLAVSDRWTHAVGQHAR